MPKLTYEIPESRWPTLVRRAKRERVSPRALVLWELRAWLERLEADESPAAEQPDDQVAA